MRGRCRGWDGDDEAASWGGGLQNHGCLVVWRWEGNGKKGGFGLCLTGIDQVNMLTRVKVGDWTGLRVDWFCFGPKGDLSGFGFSLFFWIRLGFKHKDLFCNCGKVEGVDLAFSKFVSKGIKCQ